jgi:Pseudouridylate synthases, 23S RNA-specific
MRPDMDLLPILLHDEHLVVVDKPPGMLVHRTPLAGRDERFVLQTLRDQLGRHVYPVHRLDRGTSGVLLFALDADTAHRLTGRFAARETHKRYLALVRGWTDAAGRIDHPLSRLDEEPPPQTDRGVVTTPQPALTRYERLATLEVENGLGPHPTSRYALLSLVPETGRQHQLRRHLKHASHPIIGDATYGKGDHNRWWARQLGIARLWLHAQRLELPHPWSGQPLRIEAPPDAHWRRLCALPGWRWDRAEPGLTP